MFLSEPQVFPSVNRENSRVCCRGKKTVKVKCLAESPEHGKHSKPVNSSACIRVGQCFSTLFFFFITDHLQSLLRYFFLIALPQDIICLFIFGCTGSSLLCAGFLWLWQVGATLVAIYRLLIAVASFAAEHGLRCRCFSNAAPGLRCPVEHGIFTDHRLSPRLLYWEVNS